MSVNPPAVNPSLPAVLPSAEYIRARLGTNEANWANQRGNWENYTLLALGQMSRALSIPMPSAPVTYDPVPLKSSTVHGVTRSFPVANLTAVRLGQRLLNIASGPDAQYQLSLGTADVCVEEQPIGSEMFGVGLIFNWRWRPMAGKRVFYCDYQAGMDSLPADLLEVWFQLVQLMDEERGRTGVTKLHNDKYETEYTRLLPSWAQTTMTNYKRTREMYG